MRLPRATRVALASLTAVMLLGGSATALDYTFPSVDWTSVDLSADPAVKENSVAIDGDLVAWSDDEDIVVKNLATGEIRTIPDPSANIQANAAISGDRIVYMNGTFTAWNVLMYEWSTDSVTPVATTTAMEWTPKIDGNHVVWWDDTNDDLWMRVHGESGFGSPVQLSMGYPNVVYDVDNGRLAFLDKTTHQMWIRSLSPLEDWGSPVHTFTDSVASLDLHGDRVVVGVQDSGGDYDVLVYDIAADTVLGAADNDAVSETRPTIFDRAVAWHQYAGTDPADIGYEWLGGPIPTTPSFGGPESDGFPSIYGHRIAYQRNDGIDFDVLLATSDTKLQDRTYGDDRYATAAAVSAAYFSGATDVVLCNGQNFPDALSAVPLARALRAPLLLTGPTTLAPAALAEITRLAPEKVWIIGGSSVVSDGIFSQLDAAYTVERLSGEDRYETSAVVARQLEDLLGDDTVFRAFFARGDDFADALAVGPVAAAASGPVMLVRTGDVPGSIADAIDDLNITEGYVIGGTAVVSPATDTALQALLNGNGGVGDVTERWSGTNRYGTAAAVANNGVENAWIDLDCVGFAIGTNFPDALGGGAALGAYGSALMLTDGTSLSPETVVFLNEHRYEIGRMDAFGGPDVLSESVYDAIAALIQ